MLKPGADGAVPMITIRLGSVYRGTGRRPCRWNMMEHLIFTQQTISDSMSFARLSFQFVAR